MTRWTLDDNKKAARQGWVIVMVLFLTKEVPTVQRIDDPKAWDITMQHNTPRFQSDECAQAYVAGRADAGDSFAKRALRYATGFRCVGRIRNWNDLNYGSKS